MTAEITTLCRGVVALVDDEDMERVLAAGPWRVRISRYAAYVYRAVPGYRNRRQDLHTFLTGWPLVDHANGNGLDNRRANLRDATPAQNFANMLHRAPSESGYVGVRRFRRRYKAQIQVDGDVTCLGWFATAEEAARAYDAAAIAAWGEYARPNFPQEAPA